MGNCTKKTTTPVSSKHPFSIPDFYYLHTQKRCLLHFKAKSPQKLSKHLVENPKILPNSAVGVLSDKLFIVAGGSNSHFSFADKVSKIDPFSVQSWSLSPLPIKSREGYLFQYKEWVYYVGGITGKKFEQGCPIMRYHLQSDFWEILKEAEGFLKPKEYLRSPETKHPGPKVSQILYAGAFMRGSVVYIVGGMYVNSSKNLKPIDSVFFVDFSEKRPSLKVAEVKIPFRIIKPSCGTSDSKAVITGGFDPKTGSQSYLTVLLTFGETIRYKTLNSPKCELVHNYPPLKFPGTILFTSYPYCAIFQVNTEEWSSFKLFKDEVASEKVSFKFTKQTPQTFFHFGVPKQRKSLKQYQNATLEIKELNREESGTKLHKDVPTPVLPSVSQDSPQESLECSSSTEPKVPDSRTLDPIKVQSILNLAFHYLSEPYSKLACSSTAPTELVGALQKILRKRHYPYESAWSFCKALSRALESNLTDEKIQEFLGKEFTTVKQETILRVVSECLSL